jgi:hypothetical protein
MQTVPVDYTLTIQSIFIYFAAECIAYAIAHLIEIIHRLECILKKEYLSISDSTVDAMDLAQIYKDECPKMCRKVPLYYNVGLHKLLYLAQHIRNQGISLMVIATVNWYFFILCGRHLKLKCSHLFPFRLASSIGLRKCPL